MSLKNKGWENTISESVNLTEINDYWLFYHYSLDVKLNKHYLWIYSEYVMEHFMHFLSYLQYFPKFITKNFTFITIYILFTYFDFN